MKFVRSAKIVVLNADKKALLLRRSGTHPRQPYAPDLPGGVIDPDESMEAGLVRELKEETGLTIDPADVILLHSAVFDNVPGMSIRRLLYAARLKQPTPSIVLSSEHDQYSWIDVSELKKIEEPYQKGIDYANEHNLWDEV